MAKLWSAFNIIFTEFPTEGLLSKGFSLNEKVEEGPDGVYHRFLPLQNACLEWIEVIDEESFLKDKKNSNHSHLAPGIRLIDSEESISVDQIPILRTNRPQQIRGDSHLNGVTSLKGLLWNLPSPDIKLEDGIRIYQAQSSEPYYTDFQKRKDFPFWAVVLSCEDLEKFVTRAVPDSIIEFEGKKACLIKEYLTCWDIIVIED
jgi:hypothetical protein